jgi:hypothetical protein
LKNLIISGNSSDSGDDGGGIYCNNSSPIITNVNLYNNTASKGGGIYLSNSGSQLTNVNIYNNSSNNGAGIYCLDSNPNLTGVTLSDNAGGGIFCWWNSNPTVINTIIRNNQPQNIFFSQYDDSNTISLSYSNIEGADTGVVTNDNGTVVWGSGNIDSNPLFCDSENGDYSLAENSSCVGSGENGANMGAFGVGCGPINLAPIINDIPDQQTNEEEPLVVEALLRLFVDLEYH